MIPRTLFNSDHDTFRATVRKFLENEAVPFHEEWEHTGQVPKEVWRKAGEQGFLCPMVSEQYGGLAAIPLHLRQRLFDERALGLERRRA